MSITEAIELLKAYNGPLSLKLHTAASDEMIGRVETAYGIELPIDFKTFYRFTDGFETVEDIFNMIPLKEIIANREKYKSLSIAEYMIYSDDWVLEVNAENPDDYTISAHDFEKGEVVLTKSLGEFITRFLKGGVFMPGGLCAWLDEIKARQFGNSDPVEMKPVFWVYRECLKRGLMTKEEVIGRADWIIATEDEPDHFFIELSLSRDVNNLIEVLDSLRFADDVMQVRAFFDVIYIKLLIKKISIDHVISIIDDFSHDERFTAFERNKMWGFIVESDYLYDVKPEAEQKKQFYQELNDFFAHYGCFNLYNYKGWEKINTDLVAKFEGMNPDLPAENKTRDQPVSTKDKKKKRIRNDLLFLGLMLALLIIEYYLYAPGILPFAIVIIAISYRRFKKRSRV